MSVIRDASPDDAEACAAIYAPYVTDSVISFEYEPPTVEQMASRIAGALRTHAWLVFEDDDGSVVGYAYASTFRERAAYDWSCEVSVYVGVGSQRRGVGRALYAELFERLAARGFVTFVAGMTLPNDASMGMHKAMGFEEVGTLRNVGWKNGAWHDLALLQRQAD